MDESKDGEINKFESDLDLGFYVEQRNLKYILVSK